MSRFSEFVDSVRERGARFLDRLGRGRRAADHVQTILSDSIVDVFNGAVLLRASAHGSPGVEVHDALKGPTDPECEAAAGQHWSIPHALANKKQHIGCTRSFSALKPGDATPLDRE